MCWYHFCCTKNAISNIYHPRGSWNCVQHVAWKLSFEQAREELMGHVRQISLVMAYISHQHHAWDMIAVHTWSFWNVVNLKSCTNGFLKGGASSCFSSPSACGLLINLILDKSQSIKVTKWRLNPYSFSSGLLVPLYREIIWQAEGLRD